MITFIKLSLQVCVNVFDNKKWLQPFSLQSRAVTNTQQKR